jgi:diguanylate cyclase (GGDEF)-like protein
MILSAKKREVLKSDADMMLKEVEELMGKLQLDESIQKLQVVMNDYEILGEYVLLLKCHLYSAVCHYNLGNLKMAFELTNTYEGLCKQYKLPIDKAEYFALVGLQYMYKGDLNKAITYYNDAADDALQSCSYRRYITSKKHVALAASMLNEFEIGVEAVNDAKLYLHLIDEEDVNQIEVYLVEISIYLAMDQFDLALEQLQFVSSHPVLLLDEVTHSLYYENYANYHFKIGNLELAIECASEALHLLKGKNQHSSEQDIYELLIKVCKQRNDLPKLVEVYGQYVESLKDSMNKSYLGELSKRDFEDMKRLTEIDNLTGVYNRKYLMEKASEWLDIAPLNNDSIICSVFDVDHFKLINDTHGHLIGDELLKSLANSCNSKMIKADMFLARYGGDEFVIVYRTANLDEALQYIEGIYSELNSLIIEISDYKFNLSISMGLSYTALGEYQLFEDLFREADEALYRSKQKGRKLLTMYTG